MTPYGLKKRIFKIHPHNECAVCGENSISKYYARHEWQKEDGETMLLPPTAIACMEEVSDE